MALPPEPPLLRFESVSVVVGSGVALLADVDADVVAGAITVVAGPSGAGKSTLLRLGDRLDIPTSGRVLFEGADIAGIDPRQLRRSVGMVFQRPVLFAGSVVDNLKVADPEASPERMGVVLEQVGLERSMLERTGDDLSGGEAQRVCIARTLLTEPKVLLMDEPTSSLDPANRRAIEALARQFADRGLGVMWVSHDHEQVARLADHLIVLRDGRRVSEFDAEAYLSDGGEQGNQR
jgi:putative ABC transport system ATP-binding protein